MPTAENPNAGQGPVMLDIGGDVGALIVTMPASLEDLEVEIRPAGATAAKTAEGGGATTDQQGHDDGQSHHHSHDHQHDHSHSHSHDHGHDHDGPTGHAHPASPYPHVGVVGRPGPDGPAYTLVYPSVVEGEYELVPIPGDDIAMTASVVGGEVTQVSWPTPV